MVEGKSCLSPKVREELVMSKSNLGPGDDTDLFLNLSHISEESGEPTCSIDSNSGTVPKFDRETVESEHLLASGTLIGRYRIVRTLGSGGFGVVYLAHDTSLDRDVAIKISRSLESLPNRTRDSLFVEARAAASLDHQNIIRVYDVDQWQDRTYVVMELVQGKSLADEIASQKAIPMQRILSIAAQIAAALVHLHAKGIIHRDLKPANILLAADSVVKVTDLGLALTDDSPLWRKRHVAGTRRYMSPEQVLGEVHRIDGRTDIWGFGVVLYEMLTLHSPFRATENADLFHCILKEEAPSPRQRRPETPESLERLCLKCISQRMSSRFQSAKELREAIDFVQREYESTLSPVAKLLNSNQGTDPLLQANPGKSTVSTSAVSKTDRHNSSTHSDHSDLKGMIPRGFRPFGPDDSEYYYRMMPGPYDLQGRPAILTFWQSWAKNESHDTESVGVVYGPSGCGKSSFVQAAFVPSLPPFIKPIYFNFTIRNPIDALIRLLQSEFEFTRSLEELPEILGAIRRRKAPFKLLLILDQFEQYLVDSNIDFGHVMVQALRQCDGKTVQAMILVRDEFWTEISLFMQLLESSLSDGGNAASLPLLNIPHARKVLEAFGRAFEALPSPEHELTASQHQFIAIAIDRLAHENLVLCVRVAMFAELMRNYPWEKQTILDFGGIDGAISRFLFDTFDSHSAQKSRKSIADVCSEILRELLPDDDRELKSASKPLSELALAARHTKNSIPFEQAIRCLEADLKLITRQLSANESDVHYSLAHDYLVRPIQAWLTDRGNATWRGRAIQTLDKASKRMERDPKTRQLLSISEWLAACFAVPRSNRTRAQQLVLSASGTRARNRSGIAFVILLTTIGLGRLWLQESERANVNRRKFVQSDLEAFVLAKSQNLEKIWNQLKNQKAVAVDQLNAIGVESVDTVVLNRRRLLMSLLGITLSAEELMEATHDADDREFGLWKQAFQRRPTRDALFTQFQSSEKRSDTHVPPEIQWLFLSSSDLRLLDAVVNASDPIVEMYKVMASADGEPDSLLIRVARELFDVYQIQPKDDELAGVFAVLLMSIVSEPKDLVGGEMRTFVDEGISSAKRSRALPCQALLSKLRDEKVVVRPTSPSQEWAVDEPVPNLPFTMIQIPSGQMHYEQVLIDGPASVKKKTFDIQVEEGVWMAREEVPQSLVDIFLSQGVGNLQGERLGPSRGFAATNISRQTLFEFCNWLSEKGGLTPCYSLGENPSPAEGAATPFANAPDILWIREANGYRIPTQWEYQYASTNGNLETYWNTIRDTKFGIRLQHDFSRNRERPTWRGFPDAWGFCDLLGNVGEIIIDRDNNTSISMTSINDDSLWYRPIRSEETEAPIVGFRVVRGPSR